MRFLADSMLGRLAKWLRVMGHDTIYRPFYAPGHLVLLARDDRLLLTRQSRTASLSVRALLLREQKVGRQLQEVHQELGLTPAVEPWFSRCIRCNTPLETALTQQARGLVPDYVFNLHFAVIRFCPSCRRFFWPGTHRDRMAAQLAAWGFGAPPDQREPNGGAGQKRSV